MTEIVCADVLGWALTYDGPKFHALLCDPPYELGFMGKDWDRSGVAFKAETWEALAKHLHPGAFGMAFASARGWHRLAVAIEDAGLRIHPSIFGWSYGSGFPKATRIDTQVDKAAGAEREGTGEYHKRNVKPYDDSSGWNANNTVGNHEYTTPATPLAQAWEGHRYSLQALKPALEPIIVFQKPYQGKPVECITETGAGALWVDGGRIGTNGRVQSSASEGVPFGCNYEKGTGRKYQNAGRWPANFCLVHHPECRRVGERRVRGAGWRDTDNQQGDSAFGIGNTQGREYGQHYADPDGLETIAAWDCHESCQARRLGEQSGERASFKGFERSYNLGMKGYGVDSAGEIPAQQGFNDTGTAARFFFQAAWNLERADPVMYCAKASRKERDAGLEGMVLQHAPKGNYEGRDLENPKNHLGGLQGSKQRNPHPTVKPIALAQWLATLLLPPEEYAPRRLLIPFAGSGSEGIGAGLAG